MNPFKLFFSLMDLFGHKSITSTQFDSADFTLVVKSFPKVNYRPSEEVESENITFKVQSCSRST